MYSATPRKAAKKVPSQVVRPLRGDGSVKVGPLRKNNFFDALKKVPMTTKLERLGES